MNKFKSVSNSIFDKWCCFMKESKKVHLVEGEVDMEVFIEIEGELYYIYVLRRMNIIDEQI